MPEANVLYAVTAAVVFGLIAWVFIVLRTAKEPWARSTGAHDQVQAPLPAVGERAEMTVEHHASASSETAGSGATSSSTDGHETR